MIQKSKSTSTQLLELEEHIPTQNPSTSKVYDKSSIFCEKRSIKSKGLGNRSFRNRIGQKVYPYHFHTVLDVTSGNVRRNILKYEE